MMLHACILVLSIVSTQQTRIGDGLSIQNGVVTPPQALTFTRPLYTEEALRLRVEGTVTVEAAFDIDGNFTVLRVVKGLGYGLDENALAALRNWRFAPAYKNGSRVSTISQIDVAFKLPEKDLHIQHLKQLELRLREAKQRIEETREAQEALILKIKLMEKSRVR